MLLRHKFHENEAQYTHYNNIWMYVITGDAAYGQGQRKDTPAPTGQNSAPK
jgi:hypothetical protein